VDAIKERKEEWVYFEHSSPKRGGGKRGKQLNIKCKYSTIYCPHISSTHINQAVNNAK